MAKIGSAPLYQYLHDIGALASGDEVIIAQAKKQYRKDYKKRWKKEHKYSSAKRELRPEFTLKQHEALFKKAKVNGYASATAYLKELAVTSLDGKTNVLPYKERLTEILQTIVMAGHLLHAVKTGAYVVTTDQLAEIETLIKQAETRLTEYLFLR